MIALLASIWPFLVAAAGVIYGVVVHFLSASKTAKAVDQAKADTTAQVRQDVANETAVAATQAQVEAVQVRQDAEQSAHATAQQGAAALDQALADKGALRD